jgi:hypothetical protein
VPASASAGVGYWPLMLWWRVFALLWRIPGRRTVRINGQSGPTTGC